MTIPFEPTLAGYTINLHLITEYLAFFVAFRYYVFLRKRTTDRIATTTRYTIILGAAFGALVGSRLVAFMEFPVLEFTAQSFLKILNAKTIMGGLFGGLLGVEWAKRIVGEKESSGDLFTLPIILGIFIGRIGCFLAGTNEFTYGKPTDFVWGMNLGDGLTRHPLALYELVFLLVLFIVIRQLLHQKARVNGLVFQYFMIAYFGFRFFMEFLKPNQFFILNLSSIQWLCLLCWVYYRKTLFKLITHAS